MPQKDIIKEEEEVEYEILNNNIHTVETANEEGEIEVEESE